MIWRIQCSDPKCETVTKAVNILDLIHNHCDESGWFICRCGRRGYIEKRFRTQEHGMWEPYLHGIIPLGKKRATYQPFVFLVSHKPKEPANHLWIAYYKDTSKTHANGRLKLGYGPGGPPVLRTEDVFRLLKRLIDVGYLSKEQITSAIA